MDVRSDVFEEDPCPGTGKYIEAHYQCLGWFTFFYSDVVFARLWIYTRNLKGFAFRSRTAKEPHDLGIVIWGTKRIYFVLWFRLMSWLSTIYSLCSFFLWIIMNNFSFPLLFYNLTLENLHFWYFCLLIYSIFCFIL